VKDIEIAAREGEPQKLSEAKYRRFTKALNEYDGWASRLRADFGSAPANFVIAHRLVEADTEGIGDLTETLEAVGENGHELSIVEQTPEGTRIKVIERETSAASHVTVPADLLASPVYTGLRKTYAQLADLVGRPPFRLALGKKERVAESFEDLRFYALELAKEGLTVSRFKGLGEMNPEELWATTMDPASRMLVRVEVEDAAAADLMFSMLMGDQVEPRRVFIESNAKDVRFLDV
jgi:DNA gyrase subunit B